MNIRNLPVPDYHYQFILRVRTAIVSLVVVLVHCECSRFPQLIIKEKDLDPLDFFKSDPDPWEVRSNIRLKNIRFHRTNGIQNLFWVLIPLFELLVQLFIAKKVKKIS